MDTTDERLLSLLEADARLAAGLAQAGADRVAAVEADHGQLKRLIRPTLGFKSMKTAFATIKGFEVMRALKKGQGGSHQVQPGIRGEVRLIERAFGLGPDALTEMMDQLQTLDLAA